MALHRLTYRVDGMSCDHCGVAAIDEAGYDAVRS
jgi:copper chaperone CopZ